MSPEELLREAERLGLTVQGRTASGVIEGRRVSVHGYYTGNNGQTTMVRGWLDPPLDLGLQMRERVLGALGEADAATGHPDLDGEFIVGGDEPARVRALFSGPLADELAALYHASFELRVHDVGCSIYHYNGFAVPDAAWLDRAVHAAVQIVALMDEMRAHLPAAAHIQQHAAAMRAIAAARGLAFSTAPLLASGTIEARPFQLGATRTGRSKYHLFARAAFETTLGIGLAVRRQGILDGVRTFLGGQDILVGDAPFDKRFLIRADRAERVGVLLDHTARASLLSIDERCGAVAVDDHGVTVDPIPLDRAPEELVRLADTLTEATARVSRNFIHGGADAGPYR